MTHNEIPALAEQTLAMHVGDLTLKFHQAAAAAEVFQKEIETMRGRIAELEKDLERVDGLEASIQALKPVQPVS